MAATPAPNPRASLLAGLRTGGVRSVSGPIPHTAAPTGTFNIPRIITPNQEDNFYPPEEEDELSNMMSQNLYIQNGRARQAPLTAAVDGIPNRFQQQQQQSGLGVFTYSFKIPFANYTWPSPSFWPEPAPAGFRNLCFSSS